MIFRFDDVCINSDMELHNQMTDFLFEKFPDCEVMWGVSPIVHNDCGQRVYPKIFNAYSDAKNYFFRPDKIQLPPTRSDVKLAGHGLIHIDHRLLQYETQELSILASCSLVQSATFIPPFNKWNEDTEKICRENDIRLIKWEIGWLSCEHNTFNVKHEAWYLHAREWTLEALKGWLK